MAAKGSGANKPSVGSGRSGFKTPNGSERVKRRNAGMGGASAATKGAKGAKKK